MPLAVLGTVVLATAGGYACGLAIYRFGELGAISLWLLGAWGGYAGRKITVHSSRLLSWCLVLACIFACLFAEVCWIHWSLVKGAESWSAAIALLPAFVRRYQIAALLAAIMTAFGALSAYRQTAVRYRLVRVWEDET